MGRGSLRTAGGVAAVDGGGNLCADVGTLCGYVVEVDVRGGLGSAHCRKDGHGGEV
jgi:hypothetical protein